MIFGFLIQCISRFGLCHGVLIYFQIKILNAGKIMLPGHKHPCYFRPNSGDINTFREIFLREEYAIELPNNFSPINVIDAGANIGFTTLFLAKQYPTANIISLEPDQKNFELLKQNTSRYENISPIQVALWDKSGFIEVKDNGYGVRGFMIEEGTENSITAMPSTTLAELVNQFKLVSIDILKIDIEGSEKEVFSSGSEKWLHITKCIIIELHDRMKPGCSQAVFKALSLYNFECSIKGENLVFINRDLIPLD